MPGRRYGPPTPGSIRRANLSRGHQQSLLGRVGGGVSGAVGGALGSLGHAASRPLFNALASAQGGGRPQARGFQTPATRVGGSPMMQGAGQASRYMLQKPTQFYVGPQSAKMLVGEQANPYTASLEAAFALMPGVGGRVVGIQPSLRNARTLELARRMARYAPRVSNMRGDRRRQ